LKFRVILFFILGFLLFNSLSYTQAKKIHFVYSDGGDTSKKSNSDSAKAARQHVTDSVAALRTYKESKHYKDSVEKARTHKITDQKAARQAYADSIKEAHTHITDSIATARKVRTDSLKIIQKRKTDSLNAVKKYKGSRRYADSVSVAHHDRLDSIRDAQHERSDSMAAYHKKITDSVNAKRKHASDSVKAIRTKYTDSVKAVRKVKTDSLAKVKAEKEKAQKAKEKLAEQKKNMKVELKIKQKHEAYTNQSMLKKKWSVPRKAIQNTYTRYNYYYNSDKKMDEALQNMLRGRKENYDSLINLYPFDPRRDSSLLSADMDSIIHKVSVGIQIHDPRTKWEGDMYLLLGEAYYYKGSFDNAATAFRYIITIDEQNKKKDAAKKPVDHKPGAAKEEPSIVAEEKKKSALDFLKHQSVHNEAILWLSRDFTDFNQTENAESVISLLEADPKFPEDLKGRLAIEKAYVALHDDNEKVASEQLTIAIKDVNIPNWLRQRAAFLNGQLLQNQGRYKDASENFAKVLDFFPKLDMDFYSRKYIAFNTLAAGGDADVAMGPLKKVLNDGKYVNYYDQVYFVLGQLAVKANKTDDAITYLKKSTATPKASKKQKAISFAALGDVYYTAANYPASKSAYDSAAKYATYAAKDSSVMIAKKRSKVLGEVAIPTGIIHDQDSLLALAKLDKKEQLTVVRQYIRYLENQKLDSEVNAENAGVNSVAAAEPEPTDGADPAANWYFSNPTLMQQGYNDFKRKWGNRTLSDNWRRAGGSGFASGSSGGSQDGDDSPSGSGNLDDNGLPTEESLMALIPTTPEQAALANKLIQRAYLELAKAYANELIDYKQANSTLDILDARFPDNIQKEEELYLRYQMAVKQNQLAKAQSYSEQLLYQFPNSQYANILRPKKDNFKPAVAPNTALPVDKYYDVTYDLVMNHQYTDALTHIDVAKHQYNDSGYKKRFQITEAMALAGAGDFNKADSVITGFLHAHPSDSLSSWASIVLEYINAVKRNGGVSPYANMKSYAPVAEANPAKATPKTARATPAKTAGGDKTNTAPMVYTYEPMAEHYCVIVLPGLETRTLGLRDSMLSFNTARYLSYDLNLVVDLYNTQQGVIVVKKFANAAQAKSYMLDLNATQVFFRYKPAEYKIFIISAKNYIKMLTDKSVDPYVDFFNTYYK